MSHTAYIAIGSNLGDKAANCGRALGLLRSDKNITVEEVSGWHETDAIGSEGPSGAPPFINGAAKLSTSLNPEELLKKLQAVEQQMGRKLKRNKGEDRAIDLDILFFDNLVVDLPDLTIPHPQMAKRSFVLIPLCDIAPAFVHPTEGLTISELLHRLIPERKGS